MCTWTLPEPPEILLNRNACYVGHETSISLINFEFRDAVIGGRSNWIGNKEWNLRFVILERTVIAL